MNHRLAGRLGLLFLLFAGISFLAGCPNQGLTAASPSPEAGASPSPSPSSTASYKVYYYNENSWSTVSAYAWTGSGSSAKPLLGAWPGTTMKDEGSGWWTITVPGVSASSIIFDDGKAVGASQTADLNRSGDGSYYKGTWYDGDLRTSAPQISVDFGDKTTALPVLKSDAPSVTVSVLPSTSLTAASKCQLFLKGGSQIGSDVSLASGSAAIDLTSALSSLSDGDVIQLTASAVNGAGSGTATYEYTCKDSSLAGYLPDNHGSPWMPLGAFVSGGNTYFRIWSPDSSSVVVNVDGTDHTATLMPAFDIYHNVYEWKGAGDLTGSLYRFKINGTAVRDPYGLMIKSSGENVVMNMNMAAGETGPLPALANRGDSVIYEAHVRDFTIDSSSGVTDCPGKFLAMVETGKTYTANGKTVSTGIDHLKELGVTHVQLLPVFDFGSSMYNWGYDPVNYNIPEEQYSTCSQNDFTGRVAEFRAMVKGFHDNGLRVVMDVVYNHTQNDSMFSGISSKYYTSVALSGCGNSLNTAEPMVSRMIRDSLDQWITNYGIDGFRFDLLGVFHVSAVSDWGTFLNAAHPDRNLLLYGEPWNGYADDPDTALKVRYDKVSTLASAHVGVFNGEFRDNIKGGPDNTEKGYVEGDTSYKKGTTGMIDGLTGSPDDGSSDNWTPLFAADPEQTINYCSAHDNFCLWDKVRYANGSAIGSANAADIAQVRFALGTVLVSQGIPFIHAGDEFLRTKTADGTIAFTDTRVRNSYNAGDSINEIRWSWKTTDAGNATFLAVKDLIALRKDTAALRLTTNADIAADLPSANITTNGNGVIQAFIDTAGTDVRIVLNPSTTTSVAASGVDASWTRVWSSSQGYADVSASSGELVPASTLEVFTK